MPIRASSRRASRAAHRSCSKISPARQVPAEPHRARGAERARQRAARLRRDADGAPVAVPHQHRLEREAVGAAEARLHGAVGRALLLLERQLGERELLREPRAERLRERRHLVPRGRPSSRVTPCRTWAAPVRWLAPVGEQRDGGVELHESKGTHDSRPGRRRLPRRPCIRPPIRSSPRWSAQGEADGVPIVLRDGGLVLGVLARALGARRVVECGTAIGVSTLHLARAVGEGGHGRHLRRRSRPAGDGARVPGAGRSGRPRRLAAPAGARRPARPRGALRPGVHRRDQVGVRRRTWSSCCRCSASAG